MSGGEAAGKGDGERVCVHVFLACVNVFFARVLGIREKRFEDLRKKFLGFQIGGETKYERNGMRNLESPSSRCVHKLARMRVFVSARHFGWDGFRLILLLSQLLASARNFLGGQALSAIMPF